MDTAEQRPPIRRFHEVKRKSASQVFVANGDLGEDDPDESVQASPASLLIQLKQAHVALLGAMHAVDVLTRGEVPDCDELTSTRWDLSKASLARRMLWGKILPILSLGLSADRAAELRRLQELDIALLRASTHHVSKWTAEAVLANWSGYCAASRSIRRKMAACVAAERRILYPMLQSAEQSRGAAHASSVVSGITIERLTH